MSGTPLRAALALAVPLAIVLLALLIAPRAQPGQSCPALRGGSPGALAQLRFVDVERTSVVFTFGTTATPGAFDMPEYEIGGTPASEGGAGGSAPAVLVAAFRGLLATNIDGTPSYEGPDVIEPSRDTVRQVRRIPDVAASMRWGVTLGRGLCPRVVERLYQTGTFPRGQLVLLFEGASTITLEPASRPVSAPIWVSGSGFAPSSRVRLELAGEALRDTAADVDGNFVTGIYVPRVTPGTYLVVATDTSGRGATRPLVITEGAWP